jgi:cytochrome c biogenesis protein CcmG/thiol:disulfide interchange protein DsbE
MARYFVIIAVFILLLGLLWKGLSGDPTRLPSPLLNKPAPTFELPTVNNPAATVGSRDYAGQMALVNIWATWCVGCRQEHAYLVDLASRIEVPIYGINWRDQREPAQAWLGQLGDPYVASAYDEDGRVGIDWGVYGAPETFLVDRDGTILHKQIGPMNEAIWQRDFLPLIAPAETKD